MPRFETTAQLEGKDATGLRVPADVVDALGRGKRPPVYVTVNGYTYRSTVAAYGDLFMLPLAKKHRTAAAVEPGEVVQVTVELDEDERTVEVPPELVAALAASPGATERFAALSYSHQRRWAEHVDEAKSAETRERRALKAAAELAAPTTPR
ncbi:MAG: YdeI/OmpD-associated family protein [Acidimicrobiia bacterium]